MAEKEWCKCSGHTTTDFTKLTDYYCLHFIPNGWELEYTTISSPEPEGNARTLYISGVCDQCGGYMRSGVGISPDWTGDYLLEQIYREMYHRPYDYKETTGIYHGGCIPRSQWYWEQDHLEAWERKEQFVALFRPKDQKAARRWAEEHIPSPGIVRDTAAGLFHAVIGLVQRSGRWPEASSFLQVTPASAEHAGSALLSDYRFQFWPMLNLSGNGEVYIDCVLYGSFDQTARERLHVGSIHMASTDRDTCCMMGALAGALLFYGKQYLDANQRRYIPDAELEVKGGDA